MKGKKKWAIAAVILAAAVCGVMLLRSWWPAGEDPTNAQKLDLPEAGQAGDIIAWGEVISGTVYDISIDFPAEVETVEIKEGDRVTLGQALVTLNLDEYEAALNKLRQQLLVNQAGEETAVQDTGALEADIAQTRADLDTKTQELEQQTNAGLKTLLDGLELARREAESAGRDAESYRQLWEAGAVSQSVADQYQSLYEQREHQALELENQVETVTDGLRTELNQLSLSLQAKQAELSQIQRGNRANAVVQKSGVEVAQIDLSSTEEKKEKAYLSGSQIVSCVENGIIKNIRVTNGSRLGVQGAPTPVLQLMDADTLAVSAEVDEAFVGAVYLGQSVEIFPECSPEEGIAGTVTAISNLAVEKDGKRVVKVEVTPRDPEGVLRPGFTADVHFPLTEAPGTEGSGEGKESGS